MGEFIEEWQAWLPDPDVFLTIWSNPFAVFVFATFSGVWAFQKLFRTIQKFGAFRTFKWARNKNITAAYWAALNNALFLLVFLLALQAVIGLDRLVGDEIIRIRHYAEAYRPIAILVSVLILVLISGVYAGILFRVGLDDQNGSVSYLHKELTKRGFGHFEVFGVPPLALMFEFGPTLLRLAS